MAKHLARSEKRRRVTHRCDQRRNCIPFHRERLDLAGGDEVDRRIGQAVVAQSNINVAPLLLISKIVNVGNAVTFIERTPLNHNYTIWNRNTFYITAG